MCPHVSTRCSVQNQHACALAATRPTRMCRELRLLRTVEGALDGIKNGLKRGYILTTDQSDA
eukprot:2549394-Pyramimonas_sp.AAC.1